MNYASAQHAQNHIGDILGSGKALGMGTSPQAVEVREIEREHADLMREVESLASAVNYMVQRLAPVIKQVPATAQMEKAVPAPGCYSELGNAIREATERLRVTVARVRETTDSLAV